MEVLAPYRAAFAASPDAAKGDFLVAVAAHLARRFPGDGAESLPRAAELLAAWFLRPG